MQNVFFKLYSFVSKQHQAAFAAVLCKSDLFEGRGPKPLRNTLYSSPCVLRAAALRRTTYMRVRARVLCRVSARQCRLWRILTMLATEDIFAWVPSGRGGGSVSDFAMAPHLQI